MNPDRLPCGCLPEYAERRKPDIIGTCQQPRDRIFVCGHVVYRSHGPGKSTLCLHHAQAANARGRYIAPQSPDCRDAKRWEVGDAL